MDEFDDDTKVLWKSPIAIVFCLLEDGRYVATLVTNAYPVKRVVVPAWLGVIASGAIDHLAFHVDIMRKVRERREADRRAKNERLS